MRKPHIGEVTRAKYTAHKAGWDYVWVYEDGSVYGSRSLSSASVYLGTVKDCANYVEINKETAP